MGPSKGMSDTESAADAAVMARVSKGVSWSMDSGVKIICTSWRKPLGNRGRIGLSVSRAMSTPWVLGLPSLLKKLPGILPLA